MRLGTFSPKPIPRAASFRSKGLSIGINPAFSNAKTICDLRGPFHNLSLGGAADGVAVSGDYFWGNSPHGPVKGLGFTIGPGAGINASAMTTGTAIHVVGSIP